MVTCHDLAVSEGMVPPTGTVTFLFTDVQGSTSLWEQDRDAMAAAVRQHDEILHAAAEAHDGYVFTTAGDSFAVAFQRAEPAVRAALTAQRALRSSQWPDGAELLVRMGAHTGEADERDGDYFGSPVNRAARLMSVAHGGQTVLSEVTVSLLDDRIDGIELRDLGEHRLKDLMSPIRVWQAVDPELPAEFPSLRSLDRYANNLPVRAGELIGRRLEIGEVQGLVAEHRLLSIVGPGGIGKTEVAVQVGAEVVERYRDGVVFVDLTPCTADVDSVAAAVGRALGFDARSGETWLATVVASLSVREILIVLDNCEHVMDGAARLARALLEGSPSVDLLATSRERLGLVNEQVYLLPPLAAGSELFVTRALAVDPNFDADATASAVAELCKRLDGLPLAIELAAARVRNLQPEEMLAKLGERFRLLRTRDRTSQDRHQTLLATVAWSYEQLDEQTQLFFCELGAFTGPFDREAAAAVASGDLDEFDIADLLDDLEAKSLVATSRLGSSTRYRLLETIAAFALHQLDEQGRRSAVASRHASARAALTEARAASLLDANADIEYTLSVLLADLDDLEAAFVWACGADPPLAERLFEAAQFLLLGLDGHSRPRRIAEAMLGLYGQGKCRPLNGARAAWAQALSGDYELADSFMRRLLDTDDLDIETEAIATTATCWLSAVLHNDPAAALRMTDRAMELIPHLADPVTRFNAFDIAVVQYSNAGAPERGVAFLDAAESMGCVPSAGPSRAYHQYAEATVLRGIDLERSTRLLEDAVSAASDMGDKHGLSWVSYHLAINRLVEGRHHDAATELGELLPGLLDRGDPHAVAFAFGDLAAALAQTGAHRNAAVTLALADREFERLNMATYAAYRRRRTRLIDQLTTALGADDYSEAHREGQALTVDEAVAQAAAMMSDLTAE